MLTDLLRIFRRVTANDIARQQRADAQRLQLEHEAASEHHAALATMYRARVARLERALVKESI